MLEAILAVYDWRMPGLPQRSRLKMSDSSRSVRWFCSLAMCSGIVLTGTSLAGEAQSLPAEDPVLVASPDPGYYMKLTGMKPGESGTARVQACVDAKGKITSAALATSSGHSALDVAAIAVVSLSQFRAGVVKGKPRAMCAVLPINISGPTTAEEFARLPDTLPNRVHAMPVYRSEVIFDRTTTAEDIAYGGRPIVMICIGGAGKIISTTILETSGRRSLDASALLTARRFRFAPAKESGNPVGSCNTLPVLFAPLR